MAPGPSQNFKTKWGRTHTHTDEHSRTDTLTDTRSQKKQTNKQTLLTYTLNHTHQDLGLGNLLKSVHTPLTHFVNTVCVCLPVENVYFLPIYILLVYMRMCAPMRTSNNINFSPDIRSIGCPIWSVICNVSQNCAWPGVGLTIEMCTAYFYRYKKLLLWTLVNFTLQPTTIGGWSWYWGKMTPWCEKKNL